MKESRIFLGHPIEDFADYILVFLFEILNLSSINDCPQHPLPVIEYCWDNI